MPAFSKCIVIFMHESESIASLYKIETYINGRLINLLKLFGGGAGGKKITG